MNQQEEPMPWHDGERVRFQIEDAAAKIAAEEREAARARQTMALIAFGATVLVAIAIAWLAYEIAGMIARLMQGAAL